MEADCPTNWNPAIAEALKLTQELYAIHPVGGPLHVVLDDHNIDGTIAPWYDGWTDAELDALYLDDGCPVAELDPQAPAFLDGEGRSTRQICDELAAKLNAMLEADRHSMLAYHCNLIEVPHG